ncbi:hypothetical protein [Paenibacillus xanthanilyticus]|uniref:Rod shape-determining protein MreD n=1 Tax=Paenibacillus xanthanilyticus TaxID=1783531 RepID=A0ABV8JZP2_9BACL
MMLWEHFDRNEWYVLSMLAAVYIAVWLLPKIIPTSLMILGLVWGFAGSTLFDFTIGGGLLDFYRVNDSNQYELTDLLVYFMFAPFGYFFIYFYEALKIRRTTLMAYIMGWTLLSVAVQWVSEQMRMTHYQHGYTLVYNIIVFLVMQSITGWFYLYLKAHPVTRSRGRGAAPR